MLNVEKKSEKKRKAAQFMPLLDARVLKTKKGVQIYPSWTADKSWEWLNNLCKETENR
jgi:hypothetical protein